MNSLISRSTRRLVLSRLQQQQQRGAGRRTFHATATLGGDALDMVDTFARRHRKFSRRKFIGNC